MIPRRVIQAMAGEMAERLILDDDQADEGATLDRQQAASYLADSGLDRDGRLGLAKQYSAECFEIVREHRIAIVVAANQLLAAPNRNPALARPTDLWPRLVNLKKTAFGADKSF